MTQYEPCLHVLLLAAGAARRFGSPKQLARVGGQTLLHRAIDLAMQVGGSSVTLVLGAHAQHLTPLLKHSTVDVVINRHWAEGLSSSLRLGVRARPPRCDGLLVLLTDQVAVTAQDLARLTSAWRAQPEWLIAASYAGHTGVPAIFPRWTFPDFDDLRGDAGARVLLERHASRVLRIAMPTAAIDIDTPEDLARLTTTA
jgi:molybdenum cofactor cytidylyltransferase